MANPANKVLLPSFGAHIFGLEPDPNVPSMHVPPLIPGPPKPQLRVLVSMANTAARQISLQIPRYMRVPSRSILAEVFKGETDSTAMSGEAQENLAWWTSSNGGSLSPAQVNIQAIKINDKVVAIVSLANARWN